LDDHWLDAYIEAWVLHVRAGGGDAAAMEGLLAFMGPDVRYEDVPSGSVYIGHPGIHEMAAQAHDLSSDMTFTVHGRAGGPDFFAFETEVKGTNTGPLGPMPATNRPFVIRSVSVGRHTNGVVSEHRDYWDLSNFLAQIGTTT
jgi:hypothetical protein